MPIGLYKYLGGGLLYHPQVTKKEVNLIWVSRIKN